MFYSRDSNIGESGNLINCFKPTSKLIKVFYLIVLSPLISHYRRLIIIFFWTKVSSRPLIIVVALFSMFIILLCVVTLKLYYSLT
jgi:hypothetical protein